MTNLTRCRITGTTCFYYNTSGVKEMLTNVANTNSKDFSVKMVKKMPSPQNAERAQFLYTDRLELNTYR
jgi:hypothetical protein